ncbi:MAG: hypothetical protein KF884_00980 [Fimbriimonadaceae bacterium]|nr:hypothetical protein [Fimbriimonadaceae bacterium]QYK58669.1 MAG: hypothetical protein KF884_00980 [Fimbriimonadaceae bacterium]
MINPSSVSLMASLAGLRKVQFQAFQAMALAGQVTHDPEARSMVDQAASLIVKTNEATAEVGKALRQTTFDIKI